ncbi:hypothetical protein SAPIO_CDS3926 [Scedosporium apiospermum]|uniref:Golgi to ER traffic protein 2 n=1 Tax=Pseudallescheria apiosperma TaxID=563466 RepID=A0A084G8W8_PSEDA|nr:uncharacterized protein SAPIO_CDS3926 [Scedosporium apiospermum]KEZ43780.1 hypothetical protein SAPIO_CDS3926 [Scedosporium apiospermum]
MADNPALSAEDAASQRAAEQARLRKERREAKIRAGGSARLNRITGLGGGIQKDVPAPPAPETTTTQATTTPIAAETSSTSPRAHADPEEVDISKHYYEPRLSSRVPVPPGMETVSQEELTRLMLGIDRPGQGETPPAAAQTDPFAALMTQMLSGGGIPNGGAGNPFAQPPPFPGMPQQQQPAASSGTSSIWRVLHALFAISLGLYVALSTPFRGTKEERDLLGADAVSEESKRFFWIFASVEAILLTTRFFVDGGRYSPSGVLGMVMGFLPPKTAGYIGAVMRYGQIFMTVRADLLACVFVLGVATLWRRFAFE